MMAMAVQRIGDNRPEPRWYICGSYVLDILFGKKKAKDIDVCWLSSCKQPVEQDIIDWIDEHGFHRTKYNPQFVMVKQLNTPEAGGNPTLNIDYWRLEMDGKIYDISEGKKVGISKESVKPMQIINHPVPSEIAEKALRKMELFPELMNEQIKDQLGKYASGAINCEK